MSISNCSYYIKYYPEFRKIFGSEKAAIIFERLEYWSHRYESGFWKFFEPCAHPLYREGDSWEEEVGFSRKVFKRIFTLIGTHYVSKSEFLRQSDPFQGKLYASYYDRKTNRTYFLRNHQAVIDFLKNLWKTTKEAFSRKNKKRCISGRSRNYRVGCSFPHTYKDISSYKKNTPSPPNPQFSEPAKELSQEDKKGELAQKMLKAWTKTVEGSSLDKTPLTVWRERALKRVFYTMFEKDFSLWNKYCEHIAANTFLMGGGTRGWKVTLDWALRPENIQKVREGVYTGQRETLSETLEKNKPLQEEDIEGPVLWKAFCVSLSKILGSATVRAWFTEVIPVDFEGQNPRLQCQGIFRRDWIQTHFSQAIEHVSRRLFLHGQQPVRVVA